ncbi:hypothetical protein PMAYCL1PPCAC_24669, partial [Pristionchus mayeri]
KNVCTDEISTEVAPPTTVLPSTDIIHSESVEVEVRPPNNATNKCRNSTTFLRFPHVIMNGRYSTLHPSVKSVSACLDRCA